jgi:hypothetical protein
VRRLRFLLRSRVVAALVALATLTASSAVAGASHGDAAAEWKGPVHERVHADTGSVARTPILAPGKHTADPKPVSAAAAGLALAASQARLVLDAARPGARPPVRRVIRRVLREDAEPPA